MTGPQRAAMVAAAALLAGAVAIGPRLARRAPRDEPAAVRAPSLPPPPPASPPRGAPQPLETPPLAAPPPGGPEGGEELPPAVIRALLEGAFEEYLPGHKLSSTEYEQLTEAVVRIRALRREMSGLSLSAENAVRLRELREALIEALSDFEYVAELSLAEFTAIVQPGVDSGDDPGGEEPVLEFLEGPGAGG